MPEVTAPEVTAPEQRVPFAMPSLGADMDAGTIVEWLVAPGATVHRGDIVAVVQTDKSDLDLEVFVDGTIAELLVPPGVKVPVGEVLATIDSSTPARPAAAPSPAAPAPAPAPAQAPAPAPVPAPAHAPVRSPVLRTLAEHEHVDLARVEGTGVGGSITRDDIERAAARPRMSPRARRLARERRLAVSAPAAAGATAAGATVTGDVVEPAAARDGGDAMRRAIARQMLASWREVPHFQVAQRIELHRPLARLESMNGQRSAAERILPAAMFVKAAARAAADVPGVNGGWRDDGFVPADDVDIGVVVALRRGGLLVPVIRGAHRLDLDAVMSTLRDLVTRARAGRLRASEVGGASITITQLGEGEVDRVVPIIHAPQVAIVGIGAVHDEAWAEDGTLAVRPVVHATLSADHRAVDGRVGSLYLAALRRHLLEDTPT